MPFVWPYFGCLEVSKVHRTTSPPTELHTSPRPEGVGIEEAKRLQKSHGGWVDTMAKLLGNEGLVDKVDEDGDVFVLGKCWNPELVKAGKEGRPKVGEKVELSGDEDLGVLKQGEEGTLVLEDQHKQLRPPAAASSGVSSSWATATASSSVPGGGGPCWAAPRFCATGVIITGVWLLRVRRQGQRQRHHLRVLGGAAVSRPLLAGRPRAFVRRASSSRASGCCE